MADTKQEGKNAKQSLKFMRTLFKSSEYFCHYQAFLACSLVTENEK